MRDLISRSTLLFTIATFATAFACAADSGHEGANGGNYDTQEIARMSGELIQIVRSAPSIFPELDPNALEAAIGKTHLYLVDTIVVGEQVLDGQNNGQDTIWINRTNWIAQTDHNLKIALLLHEYLGIMKLESNTYQISSRLLNPLVDLNEFKYFNCPDPSNFFGHNIRIRYDKLNDRFLIQYSGMDEKTQKQTCLRYPGTLEQCDTAWNLFETGATHFFGFPNTNNIVQRIGSKITFEGNPTNASDPWTELLFHTDASVTFVNARGTTQFCTPIAAPATESH